MLNILDIINYKETYFLQTDITCIVLLLFILIKWYRQKRDISTGRVIIRATIALAIIFCLSDMVSGLISGKVFQGSLAISYIANIIYFASVMCICVGWVLYALLKIGKLKYNVVRNSLLLSIPAIAFIVLLLSTPWTGWVFKIDPETGEYSRGILVFLHWIASAFYVVYAYSRVIAVMSMERNKIKRSEMRTVLYFPIAPIIMLIIQILLPGLTITQLGITFSVLLLYVNEQSSMVQTDDLTKLNNRRSLDTFIENHLAHASNPVNFTFLMIDINHFKEINDNYGHMIGDHVLKNVAEVLKNSCEASAKRLFLCRYGGDEFIIVGINIEEKDVDLVKNNIFEGMKNRVSFEEFDFQLSVSIGKARGKCQDTEDAEHLIRVADEDMYEEKKTFRMKEKELVVFEKDKSNTNKKFMNK